MIGIIKTVLSFLAPFIGKVFGKNSEKALEIKAQKELEEIQAFRVGRITPRYLLYYTLVFIFGLFSMLIITSIFFPNLLDTPDTSRLKEILDMGTGLVP